MYNFRGIQSFLFYFYFYSNLIFPNISQVFNIWGTQITASLSVQHYTSLLKNNALVSVEDAIFRNEKTFIPGNLNRHRDFWESHPERPSTQTNIIGVVTRCYIGRIHEFLHCGRISRASSSFCVSNTCLF